MFGAHKGNRLLVISDELAERVEGPSPHRVWAEDLCCVVEGNLPGRTAQRSVHVELVFYGDLFSLTDRPVEHSMTLGEVEIEGGQPFLYPREVPSWSTVAPGTYNAWLRPL